MSIVKAPIAIMTIAKIIIKIERIFEVWSPENMPAIEAKPEETTAAETAAAAEGTVTITDHADRTVTVPRDPKNVVVLDIYPIPSVLTVLLNSAEPLKAIAPVSMNAAKNGILSELLLV